MLRKYTGSLVMLLVRIGSSLAINKLFAFFLGATGITALAHLQNLFSIVTLIPAEGIGKGLVKYIADSRVDKGLRRDFLVAGLIWHMLVWVICSLAFLLLINPFFKVFPTTWNRFQWFTLVAVASIGQLVYLYCSALLLAAQKTKVYLLAQIASIIMVLGGVLVGVSTSSLSYSLAGFATGQGLSLVGVWIVLKFYHISVSDLSADLWHYVNQGVVQNNLKQAFFALGKYSLMALSLVLFGRTVDFFIRQFAINQFGSQATGLWQAVVRTSEWYTQVFTALLAVVYFPNVAAVIDNKQAIKQVLSQAVLNWLPFIMLGLIGVYLTRYHILLLLFDDRFLAGEAYFKWQVLGDFFIMVSYFFAYVLLGKAHIRLFILMQVLSAVLYILAVFSLYTPMGVEAFPIAYCIRSAGYAICLVIFTTKDI